MLSKKYYEAIAFIIRQNRFSDGDIAHTVINDLSDLFAADNPNFDAARFKKACEN